MLPYLLGVLGGAALIYGAVVAIRSFGALRPIEKQPKSDTEKVSGSVWDWRDFFYIGLRWLVVGAVMLCFAYWLSAK